MQKKKVVLIVGSEVPRPKEELFEKVQKWLEDESNDCELTIYTHGLFFSILNAEKYTVKDVSEHIAEDERLGIAKIKPALFLMLMDPNTTSPYLGAAKMVSEKCELEFIDVIIDLTGRTLDFNPVETDALHYGKKYLTFN